MTEMEGFFNRDLNSHSIKKTSASGPTPLTYEGRWCSFTSERAHSVKQIRPKTVLVCVKWFTLRTAKPAVAGSNPARGKCLCDEHVHLYLSIKCPVCSKFVLPDDIECHLVMCLTRPRLSYNEDVLSDSKGECVICLEELSAGDTIARLPCLCIYHKGCIDQWFEVNRSCPEHPGD
ncbi:hypothetical protein ABMA28_004276 [Loxostege sticticalis]|uniref:E3 ubiquitin-protein ligase ZNRF1 n=1 Tax=Loxostege sticticalis TaxID=481309 RepID=A0ABD0SSX5_LOXSC